MLAVAALVAVAAALFGVPVATSLCACVFEDPSSQLAQAQSLLADKFDAGNVKLVLMLTAPDGADGTKARAAGAELVAGLRRSPHVASVTSAWDGVDPRAGSADQ